MAVANLLTDYSLPMLSLRELAMLRTMNYVTDQFDWAVKVGRLFEFESFTRTCLLRVIRKVNIMTKSLGVR